MLGVKRFGRVVWCCWTAVTLLHHACVCLLWRYSDVSTCVSRKFNRYAINWQLHEPFSFSAGIIRTNVSQKACILLISVINNFYRLPRGRFFRPTWWALHPRPVVGDYQQTKKKQPHRLGVNVTSLVSQAKSHHTLLSSSSPQSPAPQPPSNWGRVAERSKLPLTTNPSYLTESQLRVGRLGQAHGLYLGFDDITCRAFIDTNYSAKPTLSLIRPRTFPGTDGPRPHSWKPLKLRVTMVSDERTSVLGKRSVQVTVYNCPFYLANIQDPCIISLDLDLE